MTVDADLQRLQGCWQVVRIETPTGPISVQVARRLRYCFNRSRVTVYEWEQATNIWTITLRGAMSPKGVDVEITDGPGRGQVMQCVYEVIGDRLRLCIGPERPTEFSGTGP